MGQNKAGLHLFKDYRHLAREYYSGTVFVAFDTETTGLHSETDFLMEIGAVKFSCRGEISRYDQLIKPPVPVTEFLTNLTHITNEMLQDQISSRAALPDFMRFLGDDKAVLIAHNAPFDLGFINAELGRMSYPPVPNRTIDTLQLARWAYPRLSREKESGQYKLQSLAARFGIQVLSAHRAGDDARVCMEIFKRILKDTMSVQKDYSVHSDPESLISAATAQQELF